MSSQDKEKEILERQKKLAAKFKPTNNNTKDTAVEVIDVVQGNPSNRRPSKRGPLSQSAILAAARAKAASTKPQKPIHNKNNTKPSPKVQRKPIAAKSTTSSSGGALAKLVQDISNSNDLSSSATLPTVEPDDFWKHLRDWDFVRQFANVVQSSTNDDPELMERHKPLPNTFLNARHYAAAWAPLCLAEGRAQFIQEAVTQLNWNKPVCVHVQGTAASARRANRDNVAWITEENETGGYVQVHAKNRQDNTNMTFMTHDIVLLLRKEHKNILNDIQNRTIAADQIPTHAGLIGHTETSRSELNGLVLKVSKRKWAQFGGKDEMYLVKIGGNITALREFTALCKVEQLPMKRYLLAEHLEQAENRRKLSRNQTAEQLVSQMGGQQALGKGFIDYAKAKFNASQLAAIAASANQYGDGGFTLIKGPPGTGKTTTLTAVLNSLHIRQYNKYYDQVRRIAVQATGSRQNALEMARKAKPRLLVCAPSNAAVDNVILKIMEDGFIDGQGQRYNPSMVRVGIGQSSTVRAVSLESQVDAIFSDNLDAGRLDASIAGYRVELSRIMNDITNLRRRIQAIAQASPWPLSRNWEIRIDEPTFEETGRVYFVNHVEKTTTYEVPPPPEPGETQYQPSAMPEYRSYLSRVVKLVESYFSVKSHLERCTIVKGTLDNGANHIEVRQNLESHVLNSVHMVMTTLGTAGNRVLESADKYEVVVVDEAAQSVEPATLAALQLGSRHAVLVGDPQQLPATIFNVSGRNSKYDRSLFQRLEEAGQPVYMLNEQYRMHPKISHFPRHIFYGGNLMDGPNVLNPEYGNPLRGIVCRNLPSFQPFVILDLDSKEERGGTSLSNVAEARLAVFLFDSLKQASRGLSTKSKVAVITPYAQQSKLLRRLFEEKLGPRYDHFVEVNTVDAFQGREANIVIFSAVRAAGSHGIGFLSDVRRMNVALTRAKHFLFVIARCESIVVNPYWSDLVQHARENRAVLRVPVLSTAATEFGDIREWAFEDTPSYPTYTNSLKQPSDALLNAPQDAKESVAPRPQDPRKKQRR